MTVYCAFLTGHSKMVFPDKGPTCVFGGECLGIDQPVRAAPFAPHGHCCDIPEVSSLPPLRCQAFPCLQLLQKDSKTIRFPTSSLIAVSGVGH